MKEQIFSNLTIEQFNNGERLTTHHFPPTLGREGSIFMAEPGQSESPKRNASEPLKVPGPEPGKPLTPEQETIVRQRWEKDYLKGREISSLPPDERQVVEIAIKSGLIPIAGGQEAVEERIGVEEATRRLEEAAREAARRQAAELGGLLFPDVDTFDPRLQPIARLVDSRRLVGEADIDFIDEQLRRIGSITTESGITLEFSTQAVEMINRLYAEHDRLAGRARERFARRERYGIFGERRLDEQEIQDIKTAVLGPTEQEMRAMERDFARPRPDLTQQQIQDARARISEHRERLRRVDRIFNRMFEIVDANPKLAFAESFSAGNYEYLEFVRTINEAISETAPEDFVTRQQILRHLRGYVEERKLREVAHNVNYVVVADLELDQLVNFVGGVQSEQVDLAFSKTGVSTVLHFYEQALLKVREEYDGYIPAYVVVGEAREGSRGRVEDLTRDYIREAIRVGTLPQMEDWEINRAISLARGMGIINGRLMEIAATSKLPGEPEPGAPFAPRIVNVYAQRIISNMSPFKHIVYKYDVYGTGRNNRVFAFFLNRGNRPWTKEELESFSVETMLDVVNGFVEDRDARFLSVLNPFRLGGIFSRTTWRLSQDPVVGAIGDFEREHPENRNWIGTGATIEIERGNLRTEEALRRVNPAERERQRVRSQEAEQRIRDALQKIARIQPLKLFYNLKGRKLRGERDTPMSEDLQKAVLRRLGKRITGDQLIDEELRNDLDTLVILQEKALRQALESDTKEEVPLDLSDEVVGDADKARRLRAFVEAVRVEFTQPQGRLRLGGRSHLDKFVEDLRDREWKIPFNIGTDDVPYEEYKFAKTGPDSFKRRWTDMGQGKKATDTMTKLVENMPNFKSVEEITPVLHELFNHISYYDEGVAREVVMKFAEGIVKFYKKDWYARLPFFMGTAANIVQTITGRGSSFAELAYGKGAMSWDETNIAAFTSQLRERGDIRLDQMNQLRQRTGGHKRESAYAYARLLIPIIAIAFAYYIVSRAVRGRE